jgi:hypothetical protein
VPVIWGAITATELVLERASASTPVSITRNLALWRTLANPQLLLMVLVLVLLIRRAPMGPVQT